MQSVSTNSPPSPKTRSVDSPRVPSGATTVVSRAVAAHATIDTSTDLGFEFDPDRLNVYATFNWGSAFKTDAERHALYPMLDGLEELEVNVYPWWDIKHATAAKPLQAANIFRFLTRGIEHGAAAGGRIRLPVFVWDISDRKEDSLDGSSKVLWHVCMGMGAVCVILDTNMDSRPVNTASGTRQHPSLNYLPGTVLADTLPNGSVTLYVKTLDDVLRTVRAVRDGTFEAPVQRNVPTHPCETAADGKLKAQVTFDWKTAPGYLKDAVARDDVQLLEWWEANTWRGAPHQLQMAWIVRWLSDPSLAYFVSDLSNYTAVDGSLRRDGSGKFQWQFLVGVCLLRQAMGPGPKLPKIVVLDESMASREPCSGTATPIHPALGFMCSHTVNCAIEGITTHYVDSIDTVKDILAGSDAPSLSGSSSGLPSPCSADPTFS